MAMLEERGVGCCWCWGGGVVVVEGCVKWKEVGLVLLNQKEMMKQMLGEEKGWNWGLVSPKFPHSLLWWSYLAVPAKKKWLVRREKRERKKRRTKREWMGVLTQQLGGL
jgi:hypothetical protein